jgi:hypothetical protein
METPLPKLRHTRKSQQEQWHDLAAFLFPLWTTRLLCFTSRTNPLVMYNCKYILLLKGYTFSWNYYFHISVVISDKKFLVPLFKWNKDNLFIYINIYDKLHFTSIIDMTVCWIIDNSGCYNTWSFKLLSFLTTLKYSALISGSKSILSAVQISTDVSS